MLCHERVCAPSEPREGIGAASGLLQVGDRLVAVDGVRVGGHAHGTSLLKAASGTVRLTIDRAERGGTGGDADGGDADGGAADDGAADDGGGGDAPPKTRAAGCAEGGHGFQRREILLHKPVRRHPTVAAPPRC